LQGCGGSDGSRGLSMWRLGIQATQSGLEFKERYLWVSFKRIRAAMGLTLWEFWKETILGKVEKIIGFF